MDLHDLLIWSWEKSWNFIALTVQEPCYEIHVCSTSDFIGKARFEKVYLLNTFNQHVGQMVCDFQIELLNMPIHLKISLPLSKA